MNKFFKLLDGIKQQDDERESTFSKHDRVLIVDGLNLFLRNFAVVNQINENGIHVGGLGGFLRSLSYLIHITKPTSVYIVFDGSGGATNRRNIHSDYKSGRNQTRITNFSIFKNLEEENTAKIDQIVRLIHYLKCLPVKIISLDKVEADDIIAYLSQTLYNKKNSKVFIVSADQDFVQLINKNITVYNATQKEFYTPDGVMKKYGVLAENFIIWKTLVGDRGDTISGVKGLGKKKLLNFFPELAERKISLDDIFDISETNFEDKSKKNKKLIYSRILFEKDKLKNFYKIMDLGNPLLDDKEKEILENLIEKATETLKIEPFLRLYNEDGLNYTIKNPSYWLKENFSILDSLKK